MWPVRAKVIPEMAIADDTLRDKVHGWHEPALDSLKERDDAPRVPAAKLVSEQMKKGEIDLQLHGAGSRQTLALV